MFGIVYGLREKSHREKMEAATWLALGVLLAVLLLEAASSDTSCPAPCVCEGRMLDCSRRRLGRLPAAPLPEGITSL